jgi:hypothetical protein
MMRPALAIILSLLSLPASADGPNRHRRIA